MKKLGFFLLFLMTSLTFGQSSLKQNINNLIKDKDATIAVSILSFDNDFKLDINGDKKLPMLSVFKFHIALAALDLVDKGKLNINQNILIKKSDLKKNTWSPIREKFPNGTTMPLSELLYYVVSESDNNGTDLILKMIGGTKTVQQFIDKKGIKDFTIKADEAKMHRGYAFMYWNTSSTNSTNEALKLLNDGKLLSEKSTSFLMDIMIKTSTGQNKIVALLPKDAQVAHKTGSSGKDKTGKTVAENDIAIIKTPNGKTYAISVFISDSMESEETNTKTIADISKLAWDYFNN